jgi:hypothetical protein
MSVERSVAGVKARSDAERREGSSRRRPTDIDGDDVRAPRTVAEIGQQSLQRHRRPLGDTPHGSVGLVGDPPDEAEHVRLAEDVKAEPDALHSAADDGLDPGYARGRRLIRHERAR